MALPPGAVTRDTLISVKVTCNEIVRKIKLPLSDCNATTLPAKLRIACIVFPNEEALIERYSDSAGGYVVLDATKPAIYKALVRAAKAKGKLRLRVTRIPPKRASLQPPQPEPIPIVTPQAPVTTESQDFTPAQPRMPGAGIFEYRATHTSQEQPPAISDEAPVPQPFATEMKETANMTPAVPQIHNLAFRTRNPNSSCPAFQQAAWSVYCNVCDVSMSDVHYHCSICDGGDYDLCETCVNSGKLCPGEDHWLIKRFIRDGKVVTSVTERVGRKFQKEALEVKTMPGGFSFAEDSKPAAPAVPTLSEPTRTCNSCVAVLPEGDFITCDDCEDYDLCMTCHIGNSHGHNPMHTFKPARDDATISLLAQPLLKAGRNVAHNAICDMCDKKIFGIRHKCLNCPDWDVCHDCHSRVNILHPNHRFVAISEPLPEPRPNNARHFGIYCDGIQCRAQRNQTYITGDRFKCAVCHDTDFCASCEASPISSHNRTHPMIKFRTPVRNVSITTTNEDVKGNVRNMGDRKTQRSTAAAAASPPAAAVVPVQEAVKPIAANTATAVQTVAEIPPTVEEPATITAQPRDGDVLVSAASPVSQTQAQSPVPSNLLTAAFVRDTIPDGTCVRPGSVFTQVWTLRNEGPYVWPAGCSVRYVGGDNMLNVDNVRPASVVALAKATESSVVARQVEVGEEVAFRITLRAPVREGKSISYWRLKSADDIPFGHRLWCDIEVRSSAAPILSSETLINGPTEPTFGSAAAMTSAHPQSAYQARIQAMHETQLRLLQHQRMLQHGQYPRADYRAVSAPMASMTSHIPLSVQPDSVATAKARVEALKTKIMKQRAGEPAALHPLLVQARESLSARQPEADGINVPKREGVATAAPVPLAAKDEDEAEFGASSTSSSQMIFPKLDKESSASSIISAKPAYVQTEAGQVEQSAAITTPADDIEHDEHVIASPDAEDFDDLEVVSAGIVSDDEEDDGFLTDEEYDILDASDSETVASP